MKRTLVGLLLLFAAPLHGQSPDYTTVDGIMTELYASVTRAPGEPFAWDRLRAIMHPEGILIPQPVQRQGETAVMNVEDFIAWIDGAWEPIIGTRSDAGFYEKQINLVVDQYGDIAHAFTTYEKGPFDTRQPQARGINGVQLIKRDGRWWVISMTWDEENTAGPLPNRYRGY